MKPAIGAVGGPDAILDVEAVAALDGRHPARHRALVVVGVQQLDPAVPELLALWDAGILDPLAAQVVAVAVGPTGPYQLRQRLGQGAEPLLALAQRLLGPLVLGDVPGQGHSEPAATLPERPAPDLDREHRPVLPPVAGFEHEDLPGVQPPPGLLERGGGHLGVEV